MVTRDRSIPGAIIALLLVVPSASIGILAVLYFDTGVTGRAVYGLSKVWMIAFPVYWILRRDRSRLLPGRLSLGGAVAGTLSGLVILMLFFGVYLVAGLDWIPLGPLRNRAAAVGLMNAWTFIAGAAYWCLINSLLEEFVWRRFVYTKCRERLPITPAIFLSAGFFTLHHVLAVLAYVSPVIAVPACLGVFCGGVFWAFLYQRFGSVWPAYISHLIADIAVFVVAWNLLFQ